MRMANFLATKNLSTARLRAKHRHYYASGQLKRREHFISGKRQDGECFGPSGEAIPYFEYYINPVYSEGNGSPSAIIKAIGKRFTYPDNAPHTGNQAVIILTFTVTPQGRVADVKIVEGLSAPLNLEAILAVRKLRKFAPARVDGVPVPFAYKVPIVVQL